MTKSSETQKKEIFKMIEIYEKWGKSYFWRPIKNFNYSEAGGLIEVEYNNKKINIVVSVSASRKNIYVERYCALDSEKCTIRKIKNFVGYKEV